MIAKIRSLKNHPGFMKYFKNTSWLFAEKLFRIAAGLLVVIWVARYLGPSQFGLFSYAQSFAGLFSVVAALGLNGIVIRDLVKDAGRREEIMGTAFWLKLMGSFAVLGILAAVLSLTSDDAYINTLIFIIASAVVFQSFNVIDFYFQSRVLSRYSVFANIISLLSSSSIKILLILYRAPLIAFAWVVLFESAVLSAGFVYFYLRTTKFNIADLKFRASTASQLLKDSWPLIVSSIAIIIYLKIDQVMIMKMMGSEAVGQYAAAVRISEAWYFIPMIITSSLFPAILNAKSKSEDLYYARLQKLYSLMAWMAIGIALPMTFMSSWVMNLLYGEQYSQAGSVLRIHIWGGLFVFLGVAGAKWLLSEDLQIYSTINTFTGAVSNIVLNYILISAAGIDGAAWATVISYAVSGYGMLFVFSKTRKNFFNITKSIFTLSFFNRRTDGLQDRY